MTPELDAYLAELQIIAHRVERLLGAVDGLLDLPESEAHGAAINLLEVARLQTTMLNQKLDSSALARVER